MKKLFAVLSVLFVMGTTSVFASTGIGAQFGSNLGNSIGGNAALTFKLNTVPCVFAADLGFGSSYFAAGLTADWWSANPKIEGSWRYYYGLGVGGSVHIANGGFGHFSAGPRAVLGTNIFVLKGALEFYLQGAYQPLVIISDGLSFAWFNFPVAAGFRFWF